MRNLLLTIAFISASVISTNAVARINFDAKNQIVRHYFQSANQNRAQSGDESLTSLKKTLNDEARKILSEQNAVLTRNGEKLLKKMIAAGAKRLRRDGGTEELLNQAKENVRKFTLAIVQNGDVKKIPKVETTRGGASSGFYDRQVTKKSVKAAKDVCPLYPICN